MTTLKELVDKWLLWDQNEKTRQEIHNLWKTGNTKELETRMRKRIEFGTAGLRGKMEAGWSRMNDLTVIQASQGLCAYVKLHVKDATTRGIVIGHDHRHNSERWARLTAAAFMLSGVKSYLLQGFVHTPIVPFSVRRLRAACGVMITASHNPKQDNGYKVYWENAVQIIEPHDKGISEAITANLEPKSWDVNNITFSALFKDVTTEMHDLYFEELVKLSNSRVLNGTTHIKFVNTSMHGVSDRFVSKAFSVFGLGPYIPVKEQQQPDPEFPTVRFPNPEEKGALDLALSVADTVGALYVLAQDPDSDRFSAAEKGVDGDWMVFTGDQLGTLFGHRTFELYRSSGKSVDKLAMVASTVSSKMLEAIALSEGFKFVECLTGFKYIGNVSLDLVNQGFEVPFGYEEAIGYMFGSHIRDKDGVAATMSFVEMAVSLRAQGSYLRQFALTTLLIRRYGFFKTSNGYFICNEPATVDSIFARLRAYQNVDDYAKIAAAPSYPNTIAGLTITRVVDLTTGYDSTNPPTFKPSLPLSSGHMIQFRGESRIDGTKITLTTRTSGTEPKIKYYLEGSGRDAKIVSALLAQMIEELRDVWLEAGRNGLGHA